MDSIDDLRTSSYQEENSSPQERISGKKYLKERLKKSWKDIKDGGNGTASQDALLDDLGTTGKALRGILEVKNEIEGSPLRSSLENINKRIVQIREDFSTKLKALFDMSSNDLFVDETRLTKIKDAIDSAKRAYASY